MNTVIAGVLLGGTAGTGAVMALRALRPAPPALAAALRQLDTGQPDRGVPHPAVRAAAAVVRVPQRDLDLIGHSSQRYLLTKLAMTLLGLLFPPAAAALATLAGLRLPVAVPAGGSLLLAAALYGAVDLAVRQEAAAAREQFARAVAVYLNLVALELAASRGPTEALERAAAVGDSWVFARIRTALNASRYRLEPPWQALRAVADRLGVPELGDVGDIMQLAGDDGASVYDSLRSRARSLRTALLAAEEDRATTATTVLYIPTSLLVLVLFALAAYPALIRLLG